jgi:hypothetical protein
LIISCPNKQRPNPVSLKVFSADKQSIMPP